MRRLATWSSRLPALAAATALGLGALSSGPAPLLAQGMGLGAHETECCVLLLVPVGARSSALGGTITARAGPDAVFGNPAGLAELGSSTFVIHHSDMSLVAQIDAFSLLLRPFSSTIGLTYQLFDQGEIVTTEGPGEPTGELSFRDHLLITSFSIGLGHGLATGFNYKFFQQRVDCTGLCGGYESVSTTHGADLGLRYHPAWHPPLELGVAIRNLGFSLEDAHSERATELPARLHVGVAYDVLDAERRDRVLAVRILLDVRDRLRDLGDPVASLGLELDMQRTVFLRAGYAPGEGLGTGAAVGVEFRYDRFQVAVARTFVNSSLEADAEPFQVSFGLNF